MSTPIRHHILGVLVALHVVAVGLGAFPAPVGGLNRKTWKDPVVARELDAWFDTLSRIGATSDRDTFEDDLFTVAVGMVKVRSKLIAPFRRYYATCGTTQSWRMFVAPMTRPATLLVDGRTEPDGEWTPLYRQHSAEHNWYADQLAYSRVRPILFRLGWPHYRKQYERFAEHLAGQVAEDHPELTGVRFAWERRPTPKPGKPVDPGTYKRERELIYSLSDAP